MLIDTNTIIALLKKHNIEITGVLHIGAHDCEEISFYNAKMNISSENIIWIDALKQKVDNAKKKRNTKYISGCDNGQGQ